MVDPRRRVKWNEFNLNKNKDYFTTHPIIYDITEPKTPFHHSIDREMTTLEKEHTEQNDCIDLLLSHHSSVMNDDCILSDTASSMIQNEDSMSSADGDTWRYKENRIAHDTKVDMLQNSLSNVHRTAQISENGMESTDKQMGKEIFEAMRNKVLEDERRKFKESKSRSD